MSNVKERFLVDDKDNRIGVLLEIEDNRSILEQLEELEAIRAYDEAKASAEKRIPFDQAMLEIEKEPKKSGA